jgi:hypothetical protein
MFEFDGLPTIGPQLDQDIWALAGIGIMAAPSLPEGPLELIRCPDMVSP